MSTFTEGPPIEMPGMKIDPEEGERFLKAASSFAEAKGVKVKTEAGEPEKEKAARLRC